MEREHRTLTESHFAFFAVPAAERDVAVKESVRRFLEVLGESVAASLETTWKPHVLNITPNTPNAGVVLESTQSGRQPHLTLGIDASSIAVFANVELEAPHRQFVRAFEHDSRGLVNIIRALGGQSIATPRDIPWTLGVARRVPLDRPRQFHYWQSVEIALPTLANWPDELIVDVLGRSIPKPSNEAAPEITIGRRYPASIVIRHEDVAALLAKDARELSAFFEWVGSPFDR